MIDLSNAPLRIYFVRHGETAWSLSGQHTGGTDIPLTQQGELAASGLANRLSAVQFSHVLTSPLQRARRTCELAAMGDLAEIDPDLTEWDYGDYEGQSSADTRKTRPDWNLFRDGAPNGESPAQIGERADRLLSRLRTMRGNVALFSHGQFGRVLGARWIGLPALDAQRLVLGTASISILGYEHNLATQPVIIAWNDVANEFPPDAPHARG